MLCRDTHLRSIICLSRSEDDLLLSYGDDKATLLNIFDGSNLEFHVPMVRKRTCGRGVNLHDEVDERLARKIDCFKVVTDPMNHAQARMDPLMKLMDGVREE